MKNNIKTLVLLLSVSTVLFACKKDDDSSASPSTGGGDDNPTVEDAGFRLQLNFNKKEAKNYNAVFKDGGITITGNIASFGEELVVLYADGTTTGTYVTKESTPNSITYVDIYSTETANGDGKIVITEIDTKNKTISGTFNAIIFEQGKDVKNYITEGKFVKVPYTEE